MKNWYGCDILNYYNVYDNILKFRTNNSVEIFNLILNKTINHIRPKLSFFFEKYKILIVDSYYKYINYLKNINKNSDEENNNFIAKDIFKFIVRLITKYKSNLSFKIISQLEEDEDNDLKIFYLN